MSEALSPSSGAPDLVDEKTVLAAKLRAAIQKRRDEEENEQDGKINDNGEEGEVEEEPEFGTVVSDDNEEREDHGPQVEELLKTLEDKRSIPTPPIVVVEEANATEERVFGQIKGGALSLTTEEEEDEGEEDEGVGKLEVEMIEEEKGEPSVIKGGEPDVIEGGGSKSGNREKEKAKGGKERERHRKKRRKHLKREGRRVNSGGDMKVEGRAILKALSILFDNQLELAAGQHRVITVPRRPVPKPRWHVVCKTMKPPKHPKLGAYVFFDGWDLYRTKEDAMDTTFVQPLIRMPNAMYDESGENETFVHRLVDGTV